jgi:hypothetical protein
VDDVGGAFIRFQLAAVRAFFPFVPGPWILHLLCTATNWPTQAKSQQFLIGEVK